MAVKDDPNLMLMIGQLLEAAKAASEGLKSLSEEVRGNAAAIITAAKTLETIEERLAQISQLVLDSSNPANLINTAHDHDARLVALKAELVGLTAEMSKLKQTVETLTTTTTNRHHTQAGMKLVATRLLQALGWVVATVIAVYAAANGGK